VAPEVAVFNVTVTGPVKEPPPGLMVGAATMSIGVVE
jgi:hypothetical protein